MAPPVKDLLPKPDDQSLILGTHMEEKENRFYKVPFEPLYISVIKKKIYCEFILIFTIQNKVYKFLIFSRGQGDSFALHYNPDSYRLVLE